MVKNINLDDKDYKILEILYNNARIPLREISKLLNISEVAISKRIRKLERLGIIKRYTIDIDYAKVNIYEALIGINIRPEKYIYVLNEIRKMFNEYYITNGDHNIIIKVINRKKEDIYNIIEKIKNIDGVENVYPSFIIEKVL